MTQHPEFTGVALPAEQVKLPNVQYGDFMDLAAQGSTSRAVGQELEVYLDTALVEGKVYDIGGEPKFIPQSVMRVSPEFDKDTTDLSRTLAASSAGQWFEHAYPAPDRNALQTIVQMLRPLADNAAQTGQHFFVTFIDNGLVIMPARRKELQADPRIAARYTAYARASDGQYLRTQAIALFDPGESGVSIKGLVPYTDSKQINVPDEIHFNGQLIFDVDTDCITPDRVVRNDREFRFEGQPVVTWKGTVSNSPEDYIVGDTVEHIVKAVAAGALPLQLGRKNTTNYL
jgi:hypothetical protein